MGPIEKRKEPSIFTWRIDTTTLPMREYHTLLWEFMITKGWGSWSHSQSLPTLRPNCQGLWIARSSTQNTFNIAGESTNTQYYFFSIGPHFCGWTFFYNPSATKDFYFVESGALTSFGTISHSSPHQRDVRSFTPSAASRGVQQPGCFEAPASDDGDNFTSPKGEGANVQHSHPRKGSIEIFGGQLRVFVWLVGDWLTDWCSRRPERAFFSGRNFHG